VKLLPQMSDMRCLCVLFSYCDIH